MKKHLFQVDAADAGERIDVFLQRKMEGFSRSRIQQLCKNSFVRAKGEPVAANYRIKAGDELEALEPEVTDGGIVPQNIPLEIVYEDEHLAVLNKPPGLVVHPAAGNWDGTLVNALLYNMKDISGIGGELRPGIVHRLDKDTSGLMLIAKNDEAHRKLAEAIAGRMVTRKYLALVKGIIHENHGIIRAPIGRHPKDRKKMAVTDDEHGKYAETEFVVKKRYPECTLVECRLVTGRTHQIRVHMAYIGHPVFGDQVYGSPKNKFSFQRQALHAYDLSFRHPLTGQDMNFRNEVWPDMQELLVRLAGCAQAF